MKNLLNQFKYLFFALLFLGLFGCSNNITPEEAKQELSKRGVEYNYMSLARNVLADSVGVVDLFLTANCLNDQQFITTQPEGINMKPVDNFFLISFLTAPYEIFEMFVDAGANVNMLLRDQSSPLLMIVLSEDITDREKRVKKLLDAGANINFISKSGFSILTHAILNKHASIASLLINNGANINEMVSISGFNEKATLLFLAIQSKQYDVAKTLIKVGANVNALSGKGWFPLGMVIEDGSVEMVSYLINANANVNFVYNETTSALFKAVINNKPEIVKLLLDAGADVTVIYNNNQGMTVLHMAAGYDNLEILELLFKAGAQKIINNTSNAQKATPLIVATAEGAEHVIDILIENGADVDYNIQGETAYSVAKDMGYTSIAEKLSSSGTAPISSTSKSNNSQAYKRKDCVSQTMIEFNVSNTLDNDPKLEIECPSGIYSDISWKSSTVHISSGECVEGRYSYTYTIDKYDFGNKVGRQTFSGSFKLDGKKSSYNYNIDELSGKGSFN